jgi:DnaJ-class molecular chaperone
MSETTFDVEFDNVFAGYLATPDNGALLLGDGSAKWWEVLGVKQDANRNDIRNAYRALARIHHPDVGGNPEDFKRLGLAFNQAMREVKL